LVPVLKSWRNELALPRRALTFEGPGDQTIGAFAFPHDMSLRLTIPFLLLCAILNACVDRGQDAGIPDGNSPTLTLDQIDQQIIAQPGNAALFAKRAQFQEARDSMSAALKDWQRAVAIDSTQAEWRIGLGDLYFRKVEFQRAEEQFMKAIKLAPDSTEARLKMAKIRLLKKDYPEAMRWTNDALRLDQENPRAYFIKGWIHRQAGDTTLAISSYHTAVERDPEYYDAYIALGLIHSAKGDPLALEFYNTALDLRPNSVEAWYARGMYCQEKGLDSLAIASYAKIKEIDPKNATAWYNTGYVMLQHQQRYLDARIEFEKAITLLPNYANAYYNLGLTYEFEDQLNSAKAAYKQALVLQPDMDLAAEGLDRLQRRGVPVTR